jgi:hypothetical protein
MLLDATEAMACEKRASVKPKHNSLTDACSIFC